MQKFYDVRETDCLFLICLGLVNYIVEALLP